MHLTSYQLESLQIYKVIKQIASFESLNSLGLRDITLKDDDVKIIAKFIGSNQIEDASIIEGRVSGVGAGYIAEAIKSNSNLWNLDLTRNNIGNQGAKSIIEALIFENVIERLSLRDNKISRIYDALKQVKKNISIYLNDNALPKKELELIEKFLDDDIEDDSIPSKHSFNSKIYSISQDFITRPYVEYLGNSSLFDDSMDDLSYTNLLGNSSL